MKVVYLVGFLFDILYFICDCVRENRPVSEKINYRVRVEIVV